MRTKVNFPGLTPSSYCSRAAARVTSPPHSASLTASFGLFHIAHLNPKWILAINGMGTSAILLRLICLMYCLTTEANMNFCAFLILLAILNSIPASRGNYLSTSACAGRQSKSNAAEFDVVSVKACDPNAVAPGGRGSAAGGTSPGRLRLDCQSLDTLIRWAYLVYANGRQNSPGTYPIVEWSKASERLRYDRFTIEAKTDGTTPAAVMRGPMLQAVLEDRFKLKTHYETRGVPIYELVVARNGLKLTPFKPGACIPFDWNAYPQPPLEPGQRRCENSTLKDNTGNYWVVTAEATTLDGIAAEFLNGLDRPVVNKTGITGLFAFRLVYEDRDSFIPSVKSQLGLELRPAKGPRRFLVIEYVERPTPNAAAVIGNTPRRGFNE